LSRENKYAFVASVLFVVILAIIFWEVFEKSDEEKTIYVNSNYELDIIRADLNTYGSSKMFLDIVIPEIKETSEKYRIPIGLLHAIFRVESDYRFNITHDKVVVPVKGNNVATNGVGLGGILWVYWGDSLRANKIAEVEQDLFLPNVSIRATGYILRVLINSEIKAGGKNSHNILANVVKRYYGAYNDQYVERMKNYTSDLWMKRIGMELMNFNKKEREK
jgi:hypothetical protein